MSAVLIITYILFVCYGILLLYYRYGWQQLPPGQSTGTPVSTRITVVIPARNEEQSIGPCIRSILQGSYPAQLYEIIVVNDHSTDNTASVVNSFPPTQVKLIQLSDHISGQQNSYKKKAIDVAVQQASGDLIVCTDADCIAPPHWLQQLASLYDARQPVFIAAPVAISEGRRFIEIFQSLDFLTLQGITGASVQLKLHSMCNGANLAYSKQAFHEVNGFEGIDNIASGDDMLLMHKLYLRRPEKVQFLKSKDAIVHTAPVQSIRGFFNQRIRWASKAGHYDDKRIFFVLLLVYLFNVMLLALPVLSLFCNCQYTIFNIRYSILSAWMVLLLLKTVTELFFLFPVARFFGKTRLLYWFPLMQPFHILYTIIAGWLGTFGSYQWKERQVK
jgi:cellulose synthase/poly-beta-1,6-N-acetylglucosamine synthase-like glycosyltransferase